MKLARLRCSDSIILCGIRSPSIELIQNIRVRARTHLIVEGFEHLGHSGARKSLQARLAPMFLTTPLLKPKWWHLYLCENPADIEPMVQAYAQAACDIFNELLHDPSLDDLRKTWLASWPSGLTRPTAETTVQVEAYELTADYV